MPLYYFDLDDHDAEPDPTGTDLTNDDAARVQAVVFAGEYLRDHPDLVWDGQEIRVVVRDADRRILMTVITLSADCGETRLR